MSHTATVDIGDLLDRERASRYQWWLVGLTALAVVFDGIDNQLIGITVPTLMREWAVPRTAFAPVVSLGYLGMMIGAAFAGQIGDRFGRRTALAGSMVVFGVMTMAATLAHGIAAMSAVRVLTGLGLGGALPNAAALAAEYVPLRQRAIAVTLAIVCVPLGSTIAGFVAIPVLPAFGWRGLFLGCGAAPMLAALVLARLLPESPRYLARRPERRDELVRTLRRMGRRIDDGAVLVESGAGELRKASFAELFRGNLRRDTVALWSAFFSSLLAVYLSFSWIPALLTGAGFSSAVASSGISAFNLGGVACALMGGLCVGRFGSRVSMLTIAALAMACAAVMSALPLSSTSAATVLTMLALTGGAINAVQTTMYALAAHVYPSAIRATGVGTALSIGRIGAVLSGYIGAWALEYGGAASFFALIAIAMGACAIALALVRRHIDKPGRILSRGV